MRSDRRNTYKTMIDNISDALISEVDGMRDQALWNIVKILVFLGEEVFRDTPEELKARADLLQSQQLSDEAYKTALKALGMYSDMEDTGVLKRDIRAEVANWHEQYSMRLESAGRCESNADYNYAKICDVQSGISDDLSVCDLCIAEHMRGRIEGLLWLMTKLADTEHAMPKTLQLFLATLMKSVYATYYDGEKLKGVSVNDGLGL